MSLFDVAADITRPLGVKKPDPDLTWREFDDLGDRNWTLHLGYSVEWDDGDCQCWIHRAQLNTGQQLLELDLRGIDTAKWEAELSVLEFDEAQEAAKSLAHGSRCRCYDCECERAEYRREQRLDDERTGDAP